MKERFKQISASLLAAIMVFTFMPVFGLGAFVDDAYAATYSTVVVTALSGNIPNQEYNGGNEIDISGVDALQEITATVDGSQNVKLKINDDYTVSSSTTSVTRGTNNNSRARVVFTGVNDYEGATFSYPNNSLGRFTIVETDTAEHTYVATIDDSGVVYDGSAWTTDTVKNKLKVKVVKDGSSKLAANAYNVAVTAKKATNDGSAGDQYDVVVTLTGSLAGTEVVDGTKTVTVAPFDLKDAVISGSDRTYNGQAQTPATVNVRFVSNGNPIANVDTLFNFAYSNNTNAGEGVITVTPKATATNFTGTGTGEFTINRLDLSDDTAANTVTLKISAEDKKTHEYDGKEFKPELNIRAYFDGGVEANPIPAANYELAYVDPSVNVGNYSVGIKAKDNSNLEGTLVAAKWVEAYSITKADVSKGTATPKEGKGVPAAKTINTLAGLLEYFDVTVNGIVLDDTMTGFAVTGTVGNKGVESTLTLSAETGNTNFTGSLPIKFTPVAATFDEGGYDATTTCIRTYTGSEIKPTVEDLATATSLSASDFQITGYQNNLNKGEAKALIQGAGNYVGTSEIRFTIAAQTLENYTVTSITGMSKGVYYKGANVPFTKVVLSNGTSVKEFTSTDAVVTAKTIGNSGATNGKLTAVTVSLKDTSNYALSPATLDYSIPAPYVEAEKVNLNNAIVSGEVPARLLTDYSDKDQIDDYVVVMVGSTVIAPEAYDVAVTGTPTGALGTKVNVTVTGSTSDEQVVGTATGELTVVQCDINDYIAAGHAATVGVGSVYTGKAVEPTVTVGGLTAGTDFEVVYSNNINATTPTSPAVATIKGKGDFKDSKDVNFTISKFRLHDDDFMRGNNYELVSVPEVEYKPGDVDDLSNQLELKIPDAADGSTAYTITKGVDYTISKRTTGTVNQGAWVRYDIRVLADSVNYTTTDGTLQIGYQVVAKQVKDPDVTVTPSELRIGKRLADCAVVVKVDDVTLSGTGGNRAYDLSEAGDWTKLTSEENATGVKVTFRGNYAGTYVAPVTIIPNDALDFGNIRLTPQSKGDLEYRLQNGNPVTHPVSVGYVGDDSRLDADVARTTANRVYFDVVYTNEAGETSTAAPTEVGTYKATVVAKAEYGGKSYDEVTFEVTPKKLTATEFNSYVGNLRAGSNANGTGNVSYLGNSTVTPTLGSGNGGIAASNFEVVDFTKTWDGDTATGKNVGTAYVQLKEGCGYAYAGVGEVPFTWTAGNISNLDVNEMFYILDQEEKGGAAVQPTDFYAFEGFDDLLTGITINYYEDNTSVTDYAKANITVSAANARAFTGTVTGNVFFSIITPAQVVEAADMAKEAAALIDDNYPADAKAAVDDAVAALNRAITSGDSDKIIKATKDLNDAVEAAKAAKAAVEKAADDAITNAAAYTDAAYTPDSVKAIAAAVEAVKNAKKTGDSNKIAEATAALNAAMKNAVAKKANTLVVKAKTIKHKAKKTKKYKVSKGIKVSKNQGAVTFKKLKGSKKITINATTGKIKVKKGLKKGKTYKVKVKVTAAGNDNYLAGSKTVTFKVKVK
jgi:hypothetical protein